MQQRLWFTKLFKTLCSRDGTLANFDIYYFYSFTHLIKYSHMLSLLNTANY